MVQCTSQHLVNCADCPLLARHLDDYIEMGHPYVRDYMLSSEFTWVLCMSPLMSKLLSESDFMEADVTYKASVELEYLFNAVVFNYTTLRCEFHFTCIHVTNLHVHSIKFLCPCMYNYCACMFCHLQGTLWPECVWTNSLLMHMPSASGQFSRQ